MNVIEHHHWADTDRFGTTPKGLLGLASSDICRLVLHKSGIVQPRLHVEWQRHNGNRLGTFFCGLGHITVYLAACIDDQPGLPYDKTAAGVVAHEFGHHVWSQTTNAFHRQVWKDIIYCEPPSTTYEPNGIEAFAEAFMLFATNPEMLRIGRPLRWDFIRKLDVQPPSESNRPFVAVGPDPRLKSWFAGKPMGAL